MVVIRVFKVAIILVGGIYNLVHLINVDVLGKTLLARVQNQVGGSRECQIGVLYPAVCSQIHFLGGIEVIVCCETVCSQAEFFCAERSQDGIAGIKALHTVQHLGLKGKTKGDSLKLEGVFVRNIVYT